MIRAECQKLIDGYVAWLRQGLTVENVGEACELTTPFLDRHNDHFRCMPPEGTERSSCPTTGTFFPT